MNLEAQLLAMARDQGDIRPGMIMEMKITPKLIASKYESRDAVVEAIRKKGSKDLHFRTRFDNILQRIFNNGSNKAFSSYIFYWSIFLETDELREAYLRASGLWVEEEKKEISNISSEDFISEDIKNYVKEEIKKALVTSHKEEEVVLPTCEQIDLKIHTNEILNYLERFIYWFEPVENSSKASSWRMLLTALIAEVRRGKLFL